MDIVQNISSLMKSLAIKPEETLKTKFKEDLLALIDHLDNENDVTRQEMLIMMNSVLLSCCQFYTIHNCDFEVVLKNMNAALISLYEKNASRLHTKGLSNNTDAMENLRNLWKENIKIFTCFNTLMNHLNCEKVLITDSVVSIPLVIVNVLYKTHKYIGDNKDIYINPSKLFLTDMNAFLSECTTLQSCFFSFLQKRFHFNCKREDGTEILNEVLEKMADIGDILLSFDNKAAVIYWKLYVELLQIYSDRVKYDLNIAKPIVCICQKIEKDLITITESSAKNDVNLDDRTVTFTLKTDNFLLRVVIKICELYSHCLGDCYSRLFQFIINLYRYSATSLQYTSVPKNVAEKIELNMSNASMPLLNRLLKDRAFIKEYVQNLENACILDSNTCNKISVLLCSETVFKLLLRMSEDVRVLYLPETGIYSILTSFFNVLTKAETVLCTDVKFPLLRNGITQTVSLYDVLLIAVSSFVICTVRSEYAVRHLEQLLIKHLFSEQPLVALFAVDLWSTIARYGNADLRCTQLKFLLHMLNSCTLDDLHIQQVVYLRLLTKRMFAFLSHGHKLEFMNVISWNNLVAFYTLYEDYPADNLKIEIGTELLTEIASDVRNIHSNKNDKLNDIFVLKLHCLSVINAEFITEEHECTLNELLCNLWRIVENNCTTDERAIANIYLIFKRFIIFVNDKFLLNILQRFQGTTKKSAYMKLIITDLLTIFDKRCLDVSYENEIISTVCQLYRSLLGDTNPLVHHRCLETFLYVAHTTQYEEIVSRTVSSSGPQVSRIVNNYIQEIPRKASSEIVLYKFIEVYSNVDKTTIVNNNVRREQDNNEVVRSTKKIKLDVPEYDADLVLRDVNDKLEVLSKHFQIIRPNSEQRKSVLQTIELVGKLKQTVDSDLL